MAGALHPHPLDGGDRGRHARAAPAPGAGARAAVLGDRARVRPVVLADVLARVGRVAGVPQQVLDRVRAAAARVAAPDRVRQVVPGGHVPRPAAIRVAVRGAGERHVARQRHEILVDLQLPASEGVPVEVGEPHDRHRRVVGVEPAVGGGARRRGRERGDDHGGQHQGDRGASQGGEARTHGSHVSQP